MAVYFLGHAKSIASFDALIPTVPAACIIASEKASGAEGLRALISIFGEPPPNVDLSL
jgi:hypothetical protein